MNIQPIDNRVVIEQTKKEDVLKSGIIIPEVSSKKNNRGIVVAVGNGKLLPDGKRADMTVKVGDNIIFQSFTSLVAIEEKEYMIIGEEDILAIIKERE